MARTSRQRPYLLISDSPVAGRLIDWLNRFLAPCTVEPVGRIDKQVNIFRLAGTVGWGLLAESDEKDPNLPGVWRHRTSIWVQHPWNAAGFVVEAQLHAWDAATHADATGDRQWLEVPRKQQYAERDRRTAELAGQLDHEEFQALEPGAVPSLRAGLTSDQARTLAAQHAPILVDTGTWATDPERERWDAFRDRLAAAIASMAPETYLIVSAVSPPGSSLGSYVQFGHVTNLFRAEAAGNAHLPSSAQIDRLRETDLEAFGWQPPGTDGNATANGANAIGADGHGTDGHGTDGHGAHGEGGRNRNYSRSWPVPPPATEIATIAVRTLREVYRVESVTDLRSRVGSFQGGDVAPPDLGIETDTSHRHPERPTSARGVNDIAPVVEEALRTWLGIAQPARDSDGDYPVRIGSAIVFVRIVDGAPPVIAVFSPVLRDIGATPALLAALNELNGKIRFGRLLWVRQQVILVGELTTVDVTADQVALVLLEVGNLADELDGELHGRFGGKATFSDRPSLVN